MTTVLSVLHGNVYGGPPNRNALVAPVLRERYGMETVIAVPMESGDAAAKLRHSGLVVEEVPIQRLRALRDIRYHARFIADLLPAVNRLRRLIREHGVGLVQINGISNPHAALAARREGIPVVWQILDVVPPRWFLAGMMPYVLRTAGAIMCTGHQVARAHPGSAKASDRLVQFFPPVDVERFTWSRETAHRSRAALGLPTQAPVVGAVGNLNPQKDHMTFIRAMGYVKKAVPDARFVILGQDLETHRDYRSAVLEAAEEVGLRLDRDLIIQDPGSRVAELAMAFDVFCMASRARSEGIPTAIEEAMSLGIPVVSTDVGSIREVVSEGVTGRLVPAGDPRALSEPLVDLLVNPETRRSMSKNAREVAAAQFSVERCAEMHFRAYRLALQRGGH